MSFKTRLEKIKEDEKFAGIMPDSQAGGSACPLDGFSPIGEKEADVILFAARDRIIESGVFHFTPGTIATEKEVDRTYKAILNGGHDFAALSVACGRWVSASGQAPAPPVTIALFSGSNK